jgi:transposase
VDFVKKLLRQRKKLGRVEPLYDRVGRKPDVKQEHEPKLREALREDPGTTLGELRELLGSICSGTSVFRALRRMDFTHKKKPCARPNKTAKTSAKRARRGAF